VALLADLPGLRPIELAGVLRDVVRHASAGEAVFVRDRAGVGTTLYAAAGDRFSPRFGLDSAARHEAAGAVEVGSDAPSVRMDVDDVADLSAALVAGVGPHTSRAAEGRATPPG
jgi:2-phospho-L-lactate guanylyltransferase